MFKSFILTTTCICLAGILYGQEKKELTVPAFLAPATVMQTTSSPSGPADQAEAPIPAEKTKYTHTLHHRNPNTGVDLIWHTDKPTQIVTGEKNKDQPAAEAREKKSNLK